MLSLRSLQYYKGLHEKVDADFMFIASPRERFLKKNQVCLMYHCTASSLSGEQYRERTTKVRTATNAAQIPTSNLPLPMCLFCPIYVILSANILGLPPAAKARLPLHRPFLHLLLINFILLVLCFASTHLCIFTSSLLFSVVVVGLLFLLLHLLLLRCPLITTDNSETAAGRFIIASTCSMKKQV